MLLVFKGGNEVLELDIDRKNKRLVIVAEKYGYKRIKMPYSELFGVKGTQAQKDKMIEMETKDDEDFIEYLKDEFYKRGLRLIKSC